MSESGPDASSTFPTPAPTSQASDILEALRPVIAPGKEDAAAAVLNSIVRIEERFERRYTGPLPPASEMAEYDRVLPGAADRILSMAESEQRSRHNMQDRIVKTEASLKLRGQPYALAALVVLCFLSFAFLIMKYPTQGASLAVSLVVLVTAMFLGPEILKLVSRKNESVKPYEGDNED